jgi:guanylate kinase
MIKALIFSAPSGSGKTTIVKHILKNFPQVQFSISATTRSIRSGEKDGKDYHFLSVEDFKNKIEQNQFLEWEEVYPNQFYGTLKSDVQDIWDNNRIVIFDLDVQGGIRLKEIMKNKSLSFFVKVPVEELENRLRNRGTESEEKIKMRVDKAIHEITFENQFDKVILNTDLEETLKLVEDELHGVSILKL